MSIARLSREGKRQLGQFLTPQLAAAEIVERLDISERHTVLEPSFGEGAFILAIVDALARRLTKEQLRSWVHGSLYGCEIDRRAYAAFASKWEGLQLGGVPQNIECCDFFRWLPPGCDRRHAIDRRLYFASKLEFFDVIVGNPPFGGSIEPSIQDELDAILGFRDGMKIKKETYAFFMVKSLDLLRPEGRLCFICSDTLLTIATMKGLRRLLQGTCDVEVSRLSRRFDDSTQDMVLVTLRKQKERPSTIRVFGRSTRIADIEATGNLSWGVNGEFARYFTGTTIGDKMIATSGMTVGKNELFIRRINNGQILEPYEFSFSTEPITLERELTKARLGKISPARRSSIRQREERGDTERVVRWRLRTAPKVVPIPSEDYRYYNKASRDIVYRAPEWVIFWRDDGDYVYTYKKTGNWYLHGVGGRPYFGREGLTWALIAPRLRTRYLPAGYILDSGAPCAFLRAGVENDELFLIMGWTLTDACTRILKGVINHTRNIQSKDFERLPYPIWVSATDRQAAVLHMKQILDAAIQGKTFDFDSPEVRWLDHLFEYRAKDGLDNYVLDGERPAQLALPQ